MHGLIHTCQCVLLNACVLWLCVKLQMVSIVSSVSHGAIGSYQKMLICTFPHHHHLRSNNQINPHMHDKLNQQAEFNKLASLLPLPMHDYSKVTACIFVQQSCVSMTTSFV